MKLKLVGLALVVLVMALIFAVPVQAVDFPFTTNVTVELATFNIKSQKIGKVIATDTQSITWTTSSAHFDIVANSESLYKRVLRMFDGDFFQSGSFSGTYTYAWRDANQKPWRLRIHITLADSASPTSLHLDIQLLSP